MWPCLAAEESLKEQSRGCITGSITGCFLPGAVGGRAAGKVIWLKHCCPVGQRDGRRSAPGGRQPAILTPPPSTLLFRRWDTFLARSVRAHLTSDFRPERSEGE